jgi:hypothetical protein
MNDPKDSLKELHAHLGYKPLNRFWAKVEIFLGLSAAGIGLLVGGWSVSRPAVLWEFTAGALAIFVLGGYLALAGHRSYLYQSANELTAYLAEVLRHTQPKG